MKTLTSNDSIADLKNAIEIIDKHITILKLRSERSGGVILDAPLSKLERLQIHKFTVLQNQYREYISKREQKEYEYEVCIYNY